MFPRRLSIISFLAIGLARTIATELVPETASDILINGIKLSQQQNHSCPLSATTIKSNKYSTSSSWNTNDRNNVPPNLRASHEIFNTTQMEAFFHLFTDKEKFSSQRSLSEITLVGLSARWHVLAYNLIHRHDKFMNLKQSFGPHIDNELCLRQLEQLNQRADIMNREKFSSRDMNLHEWLDTYGRVPPGITAGSFVWAGMYDSCLAMKINLSPEGAGVPTRYCWALMRPSDWPKGSTLEDMLAFELGVCLPRACDSLQYKNKYKLIQNLIDFNARSVDKKQTTLDNLYCLPDKDSPLRSWWKLPWAMQAVVVLASWLAIVIYATIKYEMVASKSDDKHPEDIEDGSRKNVMVDPYNKIYKMLAVTNNMKLLFETSKKSSLIVKGDKIEKCNRCDKEELKQQQQHDAAAKMRQIVDLSCLDGIKVICMAYVILGHVIMCLVSIMSDLTNLSSTSSPAWILSNLMPAFAVNSFFTISGLLTSFLLFKHNQIQSFVARPTKWVAFIIHRYLRIMPMYAIVVYYCKYLSKFTGSGPMWDYGTSSLAFRRQCEQESWLWTLLFGANFKPPLEHCIPSAWYLANDFQFFLVTPIFLIVLYKSPKFGRRMLKLCILSSYLACLLSVYLTDATDLRPIAKFMPHGFKTYVTFLSPSYTRPYYRIAPYLFGLLLGYKLYIYELGKLKAQSSSLKEDTESGVFHRKEEPGWSRWFVQYGMKMSIGIFVLFAITPPVGSLIPFNKFYAQLMVSIILSSYHILVAVATGSYILLASTGHGNQFINSCLAATFWKPLARLSLCVVLINIETINFIVQTEREAIPVNFKSHSAYNLPSIVASYLGAIVLCVLFEMSIRAVLTHSLSLAASKSSTPTKTRAQ